MAQLRAVGRNRPFMMLLFMLNVVGIGYDGQIALAMSQNLVTALAMPLWVWTGKCIGKRRTYLIGVLLFCATALSWLLADQSISTAGIVVRGIFSGLGSGALILMSISMLGDT